VNWVQFLQNVVAKSGHPGAKMVRKQPAVAEFPDYLSIQEADEIVGIINRSTMEVNSKQQPLEVRNVYTGNCDAETCRRNPFLNELYRRVSELIGVPYENFESMEFIKYGPGQLNSEHFDVSREHSPGVGKRVLTVFFYLSDVEDGGETAFPRAKPPLTIKPKKGKMMIWANVQKKIDQTLRSSVHAALPVQAGTKICANLWVHSTSFRPAEMYSQGRCSPTDDTPSPRL